LVSSRASANGAIQRKNAMSIVFYTAPMSSASPVAWALAELEVPHEVVQLDLASGAQQKSEFLALNPNGKVPTLVVDGTPMFEALAIMMWLGERFGVERGLWPTPLSPLAGQAMGLSAWAYVTYGAALTRLTLATGRHHGNDFQNTAQAEYTQKELNALQQILASRLTARPYLMGDSFTLVDLINAGAVGYGAAVGASIQSVELKAWFERCRARTAFRATMGY
jgi:GST-like protein